MGANSRERWRAVLSGAAVDPPVRWEAHGYASETLAAWHEQWLAGDDAPEDWFRLDQVEWVPLYWGPLPTTDTLPLFDAGRAGVWHRPGAVPAGLGRAEQSGFRGGAPVRDGLQFELARRCYNAYSPARYSECGTQRRFPDRPAALVVPGFLRWAEQLLAEEYVAGGLAESGERLAAAAKHYFLFVRVMLRTYFERGEADVVFLPEVSSGLAELVGVELWRGLCEAEYAALVEVLRGHEACVLTEWPHDERQVAAWRRAGVDGFYVWPGGPVGDGLEMRARLGGEVTLVGGVRADTLLRPYEEIEREVERVIRPLAEGGRLVASLERPVPAEVDLHSYRAYCDWVAGAPGPPPPRSAPGERGERTGRAEAGHRRGGAGRGSQRDRRRPRRGSRHR